MKVLNGSAYHEPSKIIKKYELTDNTIVHNGRILKRIRALINFGNITAGTLGGYVESIGNLSQEGLCWVHGQAKVYDDAYVSGNVYIDGACDICGKAQVTGYGYITDRVVVRGDAILNGINNLSGIAVVSGNSMLYGYNNIRDAQIKDSVILYGNNEIEGLMTFTGTTQVYGLNLKTGKH